MKNFGVIGLGRFGTSVALTLEQLGCSVLALDDKEENLIKVKNYLTCAKLVDSTDKEALKESGIINCDTVIVAIGEDMKSSVLTALNLKELGIKNIVAKAHSDEHSRILEKIGCNKVMLPEKESGIRLANQLTSSDILEFIEVSPDYKVNELIAPSALLGQKLASLDLRKKYRVRPIFFVLKNLLSFRPESRVLGTERRNLSVAHLSLQVRCKKDFSTSLWRSLS